MGVRGSVSPVPGAVVRRVRLARLERLLERPERAWRWEWRKTRRAEWWCLVSDRGVRWRLRLRNGAWLERE